MKYKVVIGLEVHAELKTISKLFCGCSTAFGSQPNTHCCPVCLGLPGSLPVLNKKALELAVAAALAFKCKITPKGRFDRKNYYYPDLPKAYQISQLDMPIGQNGRLEVPYRDNVSSGNNYNNEEEKMVRINRVHLEEEAGKLMHPGGNILDSDYSLVDYNRTGIPLLEIVSEPDIKSAEQARRYLEELPLILLFGGISDCRMEEGSLRCDANVSISEPDAKELGTKVEIKNMNSFRAVEMALDYEIDRQAILMEKGDKIIQETRHWDEENRSTHSLRSKEEASDYRYFPEPDLPPLVLNATWIDTIYKTLPELPSQKRMRLQLDYGLGIKEVEILTSTPEIGEFFDKAAGYYHNYKELSNWVTGEILRLLNDEGVSLSELKPELLVELIVLMEKGEINRAVAKEILPEVLLENKKPAEIVSSRGLAQISETFALEPVIQQIIDDNPDAVNNYKSGKEKAFGFLVGKVMASTKGRAKPSAVNKLLKKILSE